jgi:hypothetical protein
VSLVFFRARFGSGTFFLLLPGGWATIVVILLLFDALGNFPSIMVAFIHQNSKSI